MFDIIQPAKPRLPRMYGHFRPTMHYLLETEVHVYAFSMAANVLLSFFPFLIVIVSICRYVLDWPGAENAIYLTLGDYFPGAIGEFIQRNLRVTVANRGPFQIVSLLVLLFTANGIFEPLEVALNRVWGVKNRTYLANQAVSLGLIFACGALTLLSVILTGINAERERGWLSIVWLKLAALPTSMVVLFLIYWLLPNRKVEPRHIAPIAILVGLVLEFLKYVNLLTWPWLRAKLSGEYGPFVYSVTIILWGFVASMVVLAGAEWAARRAKASELAETT